jgi:hypothetical protein
MQRKIQSYGESFSWTYTVLFNDNTIGDGEAKTKIKLFLFHVDVLEIMTWPVVTMKRQIQGSGYMLQFPAQTKS